MDVAILLEYYKKQFNEEIDKYSEDNPKCAFAAGMLIILSGMKRSDVGNLAVHVSLMHKALHEVGKERGWNIVRNEG